MELKKICQITILTWNFEIKFCSMKNLPFANSDKVKADLAKGNVVVKNEQKFKRQV
jgi:hypothetical protein